MRRRSHSFESRLERLEAVYLLRPTAAVTESDRLAWCVANNVDPSSILLGWPDGHGVIVLPKEGEEP